MLPTARDFLINCGLFEIFVSVQFVTLSPKKPLLGRGYVVVVVAIKWSEIKNPNVVSITIQSVCSTIQHVKKTRVQFNFFIFLLMNGSCLQ